MKLFQKIKDWFYPPKSVLFPTERKEPVLEPFPFVAQNTVAWHNFRHDETINPQRFTTFNDEKNGWILAALHQIDMIIKGAPDYIDKAEKARDYSRKALLAQLVQDEGKRLTLVNGRYLNNG